MDFWTIVLLIAGLAIVFVAILFAVTASQKKKMKESIAGIGNFSTTHQYLGEDGKTSISIDDERRLIVLTSLETGTPQNTIVSYKDLLSVELIQDGYSISKTSRTSQAANAVLGGILAGGVGAVVGALTSSSTTKGKVKKIVLELVINDTNNPIFVLSFMENYGGATNEGGFVHETNLKKAREWMGRLNVLIRLADDEDNALADQPTATVSVADELKKLADLMQQGLLTEDEFSQQKIRLLGSSDNVPNS